MVFSVMKSTTAYPTILDTLYSILKQTDGDIEKCNKPFELYSISELNISPENMAYFIDAINQEYSLILAKKDFSSIRSIETLAKTIAMILSEKENARDRLGVEGECYYSE